LTAAGSFGNFQSAEEHFVKVWHPMLVSFSSHRSGNSRNATLIDPGCKKYVGQSSILCTQLNVFQERTWHELEPTSVLTSFAGGHGPFVSAAITWFVSGESSADRAILSMMAVACCCATDSKCGNGITVRKYAVVAAICASNGWHYAMPPRKRRTLDCLASQNCGGKLRMHVQ
jgi:hypothetical protein